MAVKKVILATLVLLGGCANPSREVLPNCAIDQDERCVLCVDDNGEADWYFTGSNWEGCPKGTMLVKPNERKGGSR